MQWLIESLRQNPEIALFLVLALGYGLGTLRIGTFKLGPVLGVLIAGIVIGQAGIPVSEPLKNAFFMLFLFAIGYQTGPQVFGSLRETGLYQIILTLVVCGIALILSFTIARFTGFDAGEAAGLLAGAMTGSAAFGAANGAIMKTALPEVESRMLLENAAVAFAVCYLIGTVMVIWLLTKLGPLLMRVDLAESCRELEEEMGLPPEEAGVLEENTPFVMRAYEVSRQLDGKPVSELESAFGPYRVFAERLRRDGEVVTPNETDRLQTGDRVALWGRRVALIGGPIGLVTKEVNDDELLDIGIVTVDIMVTAPKAGRTLGELAESKVSRGIFLHKIVRSGNELPYTLKTSIDAGDLVTVTGEKSHVDLLAEDLGYAIYPTDATDMTKVMAAIGLGAVIGLPGIAFAGVELSLTVFVGVLLGGIFLGWLGSHYPKFGGIPKPALWVFDSLGLMGFLALVGMQAGPGFVNGLMKSGLPLLAAAAVVVVVPHVVGILVGRFVFRLHPGVVLGVCAGAGTSAPALGALLEAGRSRVPALSYGISYAIGNIVLALGASLIVKLLLAGQSG